MSISIHRNLSFKAKRRRESASNAAAFAIVLVIKNDPRNQEYVGHLNSMIADDCIAGHHRDEYVLEELDQFRSN